jgi:hypothetical protein
MSQTVIDPQCQVAAPARESAPPRYGVLPYSVPTARPNKSNGISIAALVSAVVGIGLSVIPLIVSGVPRGIALAIVSAGLVLGALASVFGAMGRGRAVSKGLGMAGLSTCPKCGTLLATLCLAGGRRR